MLKYGIKVYLIFFGMLFALGFGFYAFSSWSQPAYEELRYKTTQNSTSFVRGKIQSLNELRRSYVKAESDKHRSMLRELIIDEYITIDEDKLPPNLLDWIKTEIKPNE